ncbi:MAG: Putative hydrolase [uncultured Nocardioidaceae bacterium]|uniref:Hydrolase n=1 Tax=uncultured Nocardioidaceae bacterium TaxID=253824 RepID=A0A6J4MXN3_9ACTN|nr:MAG: Putative hydrolase [uncultured Nocardioidaceae bacterium]
MRQKVEVDRPQLEGRIAVRDDRMLGFASFGTPTGRPIFWLHGTPGARRQIPVEARLLAEKHDLRIIGIDRPGIGSSTAHVYENVLDFAADLEIVADTLGIETFHVIGLSGGGPYTLAAAAAMPDRVLGVEVIGGVAPTVGPDAASGGLVALAAPFAPLIALGRVPLGLALTGTIRVVRPFAGSVLDLYRVVQPAGDKRLLGRPEFRAMFVDDLLNGSRKQVTAPMSDLLLFTRDWGFRLADVRTPVRWWHGDGDHIVPLRHGQHCVERLPDAKLFTMEGESHLGGLGLAEEILGGLLQEG